MKIAVIGTGIAGNVAAWHLCQEHEVTVFESGDYIGGHTHTHDIVHDGNQHAVDTGFIVFNDRTYPNFIALLDKLEVESQPTVMSFSCRCDSSGMEYNGASLNQLFAEVDEATDDFAPILRLPAPKVGLVSYLDASNAG